MYSKISSILRLVGAFLIGAAVFFVVGRMTAPVKTEVIHQPSPPQVVQVVKNTRDTVVVRDSIRILLPGGRDTVLVSSGDTRYFELDTCFSAHVVALADGKVVDSAQTSVGLRVGLLYPSGNFVAFPPSIGDIELRTKVSTEVGGGVTSDFGLRMLAAGGGDVGPGLGGGLVVDRFMLGALFAPGAQPMIAGQYDAFRLWGMSVNAAGAYQGGTPMLGVGLGFAEYRLSLLIPRGGGVGAMLGFDL